MTESQLRRLAATMRGLEDGVDELAAALRRRDERTMTVFTDDIPAEVRASMLDSISRMSLEIRKVRDGYGLAPQIVSNRRRFLAKLSSLSVDLTEATSKYMKAYGDVPEAERELLDNQVGTLIALVEKLVLLIEGKPD
jgi:hypothetical protein